MNTVQNPTEIKLVTSITPALMPAIDPAKVSISDLTCVPNATKTGCDVSFKLNFNAMPKEKVKNVNLVKYAEEGNLEKVKELLEENCDADVGDTNGNTALCKAALKGHLKIIELLLSYKANINKGCNINWTPLHNAVWNRNKKVSKFLLKNGANVNCQVNSSVYRYTPLHRAVRNNSKKIVKLLLSYGADVTVKDEYDKTALDMAKERNDVKIINLLENHIKKTAVAPLEPIAPQTSENKPVEVAPVVTPAKTTTHQEKVKNMRLVEHARNGYLEGIKALLGRNCDVNVQDCFGDTSLHDASRYGHKEIVEMLLSSGADINIENNNKETPLHVTMYPSRAKIVELLLCYGADVTIKNKHNKTALDLAKEGNLTEIVKLLEDHIKKLETKNTLTESAKNTTPFDSSDFKPIAFSMNGKDYKYSGPESQFIVYLNFIKSNF